MSKFVVVDGDTVNFDGAFTTPLAVAFVPPSPAPSTTISGTGKKLKSGAKACVSGDEKNVSLANVSYTAGIYTTPGTGTLAILSLASDQLAQKLTVGSTAVILVGSQFNATFTPDPPPKCAMAPTVPNPTPDSTPKYSGTGHFVTANAKLDSA